MKKLFVILIIFAMLSAVVCYAAPETEMTDTTAVGTEADVTEADVTETTDTETTDTEAGETETEETETVLPENPAIVSLSGEPFVEEEIFTVSLDITADSLRGGAVKIIFDESKINVLSVTAADNDGLKVYDSVKQGAVYIVFYTDSLYSGTLKTADIAFKMINGERNEILTVEIAEATVSDGKTETAGKTEDYSFELAYDIYTEQTETDTDTEPVTDTQTETVTDAQTETVTDAQTEPVTETETVTDTQTDTTAKETETTARETETSTDAHTAAESTSADVNTTSHQAETEPAAESSDTTTVNTGTETEQEVTTDDKGSDTLTSDDGTDTAEETETNDTAADRTTEDTDADITVDNVTTDGGTQKREPLSMPVIISLIGATVAGAAVGAVFLIRHAVKAKKQNSEQ